MKIITGDIFKVYKNYDVITHSCNCFCRMKRGIAPLFAKKFGCDKFRMEDKKYEGSIHKLGCIDYRNCDGLIFINAYMQYHWELPSKYGFPFDYDACRLCLRKINTLFPNKKICLPMIGCGLAGATTDMVLPIIEEELLNPTIVIKPGEFTELERYAT